MTVNEVPQGRLQTPFYSRLKALDTVNTWHEWKGYSSADELYCADMEYFAIRNATAVFDLTPMTKYRITGPDAEAYLNRLVTRDMAKVRPGRVAYAVCVTIMARLSTTARYFICAMANIVCALRSDTMHG